MDSIIKNHIICFTENKNQYCKNKEIEINI